jgi:hypothetical protein
MLKEVGKQLLTALVPAFFLLVLVSFFGFTVKNYVKCEESPDCISVFAGNLGGILLPAEPVASYTVAEADSDDIKLKKKLKSQEIITSKYNGRLVFIFFLGLYFFISLAAFVTSLYVIFDSLKKDGLKTVRAGFLLIIGISFIVSVLLYLNPQLYLSVFESLFPLIENDFKPARNLIIYVNSFGFAVCTLLYLTICAILYLPVSEVNPAGLHEAAEKMKNLRIMLYLGTLLLVVGMLLIRSLYQWSLAFMLRDEKAVKMAESFFANMLSVEGGFFTLVLAAAYLPAAFIIRRQVDKIQDLPENEAEKEAELKKYNLTFSFVESLPRIIAILGPILAGSVGDLFTKLLK